MLLFLLACTPKVETAGLSSTQEPLPSSYQQQLQEEAARRMPDPVRGGPAWLADASPLPPFLGVDRGKSTYVGAARCSGCHPVASQIWQKSAHATAMTSLEEAKAAYNPTCFRCHVSGYGHPGGWAGHADIEKGQVGCESCHGPASEHLAHPGPGYGQLPADGSACVACHTHDNSPDFRWESYWVLIQH